MSLSQPGIAVRDQFRAALVGTYLAEFRFGASSQKAPESRSLSLSALPTGSPQAKAPVDQLVEFVPWLLQNYGQHYSQNYSQRGTQNQASVIRNGADSTQQMAGLLAWSLEHLLDQRAPQTLLAALSQRLCLGEHSAAPSMIALLERTLKGEQQTTRALTASLLPGLRRQFPELFPVGVALYSFLRVPESYGLAVKYAFDCTHSSAISALTGLLSGVHGGLSQMPVPWLISWLTTVGALPSLTPLDLTQGDGLTELWSKIDAPFYQWLGAPTTRPTQEMQAQPPVMPLPSI
ncbi:MAG: hypothetical protein AAGF01_02925 [Cyanobacteria bacterium P01_G01_bin.38]